MYNEFDFLQSIEDAELKLRDKQCSYIELDLTLDDFIDENREVLATTIGGLDSDTHDVIASYYDLRKQREEAYWDVLNAKGQLKAINQFVALRRKYTSDKNKGMTPPW